MESQGDALVAWQERLRRAEDELTQREQQVLADDPSPGQLLALAAEHDRIALARDRIAVSYDELSDKRDLSAFGRDVTGSGRDRRVRVVTRDLDAGHADRWLAGEDRDHSAGDRTGSYEDRHRAEQARAHAAADRGRAADDRERALQKANDQDRQLDGLRVALESRLVIGQAQGLLMARHAMSSRVAFAVLVRLSQQSNTKLREVAAQLVAVADVDSDTQE